METLAVSDVVLIPFPFSDLSRSKLRPAVALAYVGRGDWIMCQITSNPYADQDAVLLTDEHFVSGSLQRQSYARPGKLFTANQSLVSAVSGMLKIKTRIEIVRKIEHLLNSE